MRNKIIGILLSCGIIMFTPVIVNAKTPDSAVLSKTETEVEDASNEIDETTTNIVGLLDAIKAEEEKKKILEQYSEHEIYLLAAIIHCEARGECYEGQVAVGAVVLNRVKSDEFPDTIEEVIYQKNQFSPVGSGILDEVLENKAVNESCIEAAKDALTGENPIGDCLFFRTLNGSPGLVIGNHVFREEYKIET